MPLEPSAKNAIAVQDYGGLLAGMVSLVKEARRCSARTVNAIMTATYWEIGRRVVESEQAGRHRAGYGEALLKRLSDDLTSRFGRGFSPDNIENMRRFYLAFEVVEISETASRKLGQKKTRTPSEKSATAFPAAKKTQTLSAEWPGKATEKSQTASDKFVMGAPTALFALPKRVSKHLISLASDGQWGPSSTEGLP